LSSIAANVRKLIKKNSELQYHLDDTLSSTVSVLPVILQHVSSRPTAYVLLGNLTSIM